jgi:hypothetical protein
MKGISTASGRSPTRGSALGIRLRFERALNVTKATLRFAEGALGATDETEASVSVAMRAELPRSAADRNRAVSGLIDRGAAWRNSPPGIPSGKLQTS